MKYVKIVLFWVGVVMLFGDFEYRTWGLLLIGIWAYSNIKTVIKLIAMYIDRFRENNSGGQDSFIVIRINYFALLDDEKMKILYDVVKSDDEVVKHIKKSGLIDGNRLTFQSWIKGLKSRVGELVNEQECVIFRIKNNTLYKEYVVDNGVNKIDVVFDDLIHHELFIPYSNDHEENDYIRYNKSIHQGVTIRFVVTNGDLLFQVGHMMPGITSNEVEEAGEYAGGGVFKAWENITSFPLMIALRGLQIPIKFMNRGGDGWSIDFKSVRGEEEEKKRIEINTLYQKYIDVPDSDASTHAEWKDVDEKLESHLKIQEGWESDVNDYFHSEDPKNYEYNYKKHTISLSSNNSTAYRDVNARHGRYGEYEKGFESI